MALENNELRRKIMILEEEKIQLRQNLYEHQSMTSNSAMYEQASEVEGVKEVF